jgi:hypothetical protein
MRILRDWAGAAAICGLLLLILMVAFNLGR